MDPNEHATPGRSPRRMGLWGPITIGLVAILLLGTVLAVAAVGGMGPGGMGMQMMTGNGDMDEMHARCHEMMESHGDDGGAAGSAESGPGRETGFEAPEAQWRFAGTPAIAPPAQSASPQ